MACAGVCARGAARACNHLSALLLQVFAQEAQGKTQKGTRAVAFSDMAKAAAEWASKKKSELEAEDKVSNG